MKFLSVMLVMVVALTALLGSARAMPDPFALADPDPIADPQFGYGGFRRGFGGGFGRGFGRGFGGFGGFGRRRFYG
ncbi:neuropeptide-like protein 29 [Cherax quadricarinatus]|uniref:neuropeptide-like protein 29 n=1 Tax=Cherax quadricarinatus TaxID=27406 RepID=UPI002379846E|nr:neuropeptide-like protein 29 [Cherax quadricarinatus]